MIINKTYLTFSDSPRVLSKLLLGPNSCLGFLFVVLSDHYNDHEQDDSKNKLQIRENYKLVVPSNFARAPNIAQNKIAKRSKSEIFFAKNYVAKIIFFIINSYK